MVCVLISACGPEPVSGSEITFACTWACVFRSCEYVGKSGGEAELCGCSRAQLAMAVAPAGSLSRPQLKLCFCPEQPQVLYGSSYCKATLTRKDLKVLFLPLFLSFGGKSSPPCCQS